MADVKWSRTELDDVVMFFPPTCFHDERGKYVETWNAEGYKEAHRAAWYDRWPEPSFYRLLWKPLEWVQDDISVSKKGTLRGIHGDDETWKLISCLEGEFYLVVVNNRPHDEQRYRWCSFFMHEEKNFQVLIPPGFGNAHLVLSERAIFHYKQTSYYMGSKLQFTMRWDDPELGIWWPVNPTIMSKRDKEAENVKRVRGFQDRPSR